MYTIMYYLSYIREGIPVYFSIISLYPERYIGRIRQYPIRKRRNGKREFSPAAGQIDRVLGKGEPGKHIAKSKPDVHTLVRRNTKRRGSRREITLKKIPGLYAETHQLVKEFGEQFR
jgi:hypothetical protein